MASLIDYRGLQVVSPDPTGGGGLAIQNDLKSLVEWSPKSVWSQSASPSATDDSDDEYYPGSLWLRTDTTPPQLYVCKSSTVGAAVWLPVLLNVVQDSSPKLGGDLDLNGHKITDNTSIALSIAGTSVATVTSSALQVQGNSLLGTTTTPTGATFNAVLGGGTTSPVLGAATPDMVSVAAVDKAAGDRRLYVQSELGSPISIGNDRLNFAATSGQVSIGGTDFVTMTSTLMTLGVNANSDSTQLLIDNANALGGSGLRINRASNVRTAQIQLSTGGTTDWWFGLLRRGGSSSQTFSIGRGADITTTTPLMNIATSGLVGWGVLTPTYNMSFEGTVAKTIGIERNTTSNTAGVSWNLSAGAATSGATDKDGGTAALTGGVSTGAGVSRVTFSVSPGVAASTSDNTITEVARFTGAGFNFLHGTTTVPTGATYNHVMGGGSTSAVLGAPATDIVSIAAVDKAAGDRRLYVQSELGSSISLGNDRLNFGATVGNFTIGGTDILSFSTSQLQMQNLAAANDANTSIFVLRAGTDGTLGPLGFNIGLRPSATGANRYGYFSIGDSVALRLFCLNYNGVSTFGNVAVGTVTPSSGATQNLIIGGPTTSPVLGAATADQVNLAAVDKTAGDRRLYIQSELGSSISLGNDRLNFGASTGVVSNNGVDVLAVSAGQLTINGNATAAADTRLTLGGSGNGGANRGTAILIRGPGSASEQDLVKLIAYTTGGATVSQSSDLAIQTSLSGSLSESVRVTSARNVLLGTSTTPSNATVNLVLGGGATTPVLGTATADIVSIAAVDKAAGDRRLYIQAEAGSAISLGNDRLDFAAATGVLSIGGADIIGFSSSGATLSDAMNIAVGSTTGAKIGTSTSQKLGFWNAAPVVQYATTGTSIGFSTGTGTAVNSVSTFTGNVGSSAYTIGDIVAALKKCGLMAS